MFSFTTIILIFAPSNITENSRYAMKKITSLLLTISFVISLTSCTMESGAILGGMFGSAIGGLSGGPRGSHVGSLVGMATGASIGAAAEYAEREELHNEVIRAQEARDRDFERRYREHRSVYTRDYNKKNGLSATTTNKSSKGARIDPTNSGDDRLLDF